MTINTTIEDRRLKNILVCRPSFYGIEYEINPWMHLKTEVNRNKAIEQWNNLCDRLKEYGAKLHNIRPQEGLPDMVFTANGGLYLEDQNMLVLSKFRHEERAKESWWFHEFFLNRKTKVFITANDFEGAGDALFLGDTLIAGYGFRSDLQAYKEIRPFLAKDPKIVQLVNPSFYHLDTCFCPLDNHDYMIFPNAFNDDGLAEIRSLGGNEIVVPELEAKRFACNAVQLGKFVLLPSDCPETSQKLQNAGYIPIAIHVSEFIKAGGACKCLTLVV